MGRVLCRWSIVSLRVHNAGLADWFRELRTRETAEGQPPPVDGTIRDLEGIFELPTQIYYKAAHAAAVSGVSVAGINIPVQVGGAVVMPGDVVLGDRTGVVFIPPHLVKEIVDQADLTHIHDEWTKAKFLTGKYKASELYGGPLSPENQKEYDAYVKRRLAERK